MRFNRGVLGVALAVVALVGSAAAPGTPAVQDAQARAVSFAHVGAVPLTASGSIAGLRPSDIASAYGIANPGGGVVGIATAYDAPNLEADLAVYRAQWGLPPCTTANGCFRKVGQDGSATLPTADVGWAEETSLDVDAVSAACPTCSILVVEANSAYVSDLGRAVNTAVTLGAQAVSASWGATEGSAAAAAYYRQQYFTHPGVPIVAAAGDSGYQSAASLPAALSTVVAVGGTRLSASAGVTAARVSGGAHDLVTSRAVTPVPSVAKLERAKQRLTDLRKRVKALRALVAKDVKAVHRHSTATTRHRLDRARADLRRAQRSSAQAQSTVDALRKALAAGGRTPAKTPDTTGGGSAPVPSAAPNPAPTTTNPPAQPAPTSAFPASRTSWTERAWTGGGSACSTSTAKPAWQTDTMCTGRTVVDIAAVGDPATGLAIYDTYGTSSPTGWLVAGGTSLSAPLIAAMLVASGHAANYSDPSALYRQSPTAFWDVATGSNGSCSSAAICTAGPGLDGPTGVGTPKSLASF